MRLRKAHCWPEPYGIELKGPKHGLIPGRLDLAKYIERDLLDGYGLNSTAAAHPNNEPQDSPILIANHEVDVRHVDPNRFVVTTGKLNELHCGTPPIAS